MFAVAAVGALAIAGSSFFLLLPLFVGRFVEDLGFTESQAGIVASWEMAGIAISSLLAVFWIPRLNARRAVATSLVGLALVNAFAATLATPSSMYVARFVAGFFGGVVYQVVSARIASTRQPDRMYGVLFSGQLLFATLGFAVLPPLLQGRSISAAFVALSVVTVAGLCFIQWIPGRPVTAASKGAGGPVDRRALRKPGFAFMASIFLLYVATNAIWTYVDRIGIHAGLPASVVGFSLSAANAAGLVGALAVTFLGTKLGRSWPVAVSFVCVVFAAGVLVDPPGAAWYAVGTAVFMFVWCFQVPLIFGSIADYDSSGYLASLAVAAMTIGMVAGPAAAAWLIDRTTYAQILLSGIACLVVSAAIVLPVMARARRRKKET